MNRLRLLTIGLMLIAPLTAAAQQVAVAPGATVEEGPGLLAAQDDMPKVEQQLKVLTEKLGLTGDQQTRIKPILQELHDDTLKLMLSNSLSREERLARVRPQREKADQGIRAVLNEDQQKKLDQYEQGPHSEMHGHLSGVTSPPQPTTN